MRAIEGGISDAVAKWSLLSADRDHSRRLQRRKLGRSGQLCWSDERSYQRIVAWRAESDLQFNRHAVWRWVGGVLRDRDPRLQPPRQNRFPPPPALSAHA